MRTEGSARPLLPVKSHGTVPKGMLQQCVQFLSDKTVKPPLGIGNVIVSDIFGSGTDIIATDDLPS
jgi:CxxC motif-containing protein